MPTALKADPFPSAVIPAESGNPCNRTLVMPAHVRMTRESQPPALERIDRGRPSGIPRIRSFHPAGAKRVGEAVAGYNVTGQCLW